VNPVFVWECNEGCLDVLPQTSSNLSAIMEKALKRPSVGPVMVTILSGDDPSEMLMRAPLWNNNEPIKTPDLECFGAFILV
jgi:hypothetical protein